MVAAMAANYSSRVLSHASAAVREAWALRRLAETYPREGMPSQSREVLVRVSIAGARRSKVPPRVAPSGGLFTLIASSLPDARSARVWSLLPLR